MRVQFRAKALHAGFRNKALELGGPDLTFLQVRGVIDRDVNEEHQPVNDEARLELSAERAVNNLVRSRDMGVSRDQQRGADCVGINVECGEEETERDVDEEALEDGIPGERQ